MSFDFGDLIEITIRRSVVSELQRVGIAIATNDGVEAGQTSCP